MMGAIAPGLSIELIISFETTMTGEFRDSIKIVSDDNIEIDVPIYAFSPSSKIIFEPFIHLGFIQVNKPKKRSIKFKNEGKVEGKIELNINVENLKIEPNSKFTLKANEEKEVDLIYKPSEAGIFRG